MGLSGIWKNNFDSTMEITVDETGLISGTYKSHTGATGVYRLTGVADIKPDEKSQCVSFSISWRSLGDESDDPSFHWVSAFSGQFQVVNGQELLTTTYLLTKNTLPSDNWEATAVDKAIFHKVSPESEVLLERRILFNLERGKISNNGATPWYAQIGFGSPTQTLKYMIDTGTPHAWVTSDACTTEACKAHQVFRPGDSSTCKKLPLSSKKIDFGPWGDMEVSLYRDYLFLSVLDKTNKTSSVLQPFHLYLSSKYTGDQFLQLACDGGIAVPRLLPKGIESSELLPTLKAEGIIEQAVVSFWFDPSSGCGQACFGSLDPSRFELGSGNRVIVAPLPVPYDYLWTISVDAFVNGKFFKSNVRVVMDTGSSFFKGDPRIIRDIVFAITGATTLPYRVDKAKLEDFPTIGLKINEVMYQLKPEQYFVEIEPDVWELAFQEMDLPDFIVAGSVFLDTVYSAFYYATDKPGIQEIFLASPVV